MVQHLCVLLLNGALVILINTPGVGMLFQTGVYTWVFSPVFGGVPRKKIQPLTGLHTHIHYNNGMRGLSGKRLF
jgi:hypothetical protein